MTAPAAARAAQPRTRPRRARGLAVLGISIFLPVFAVPVRAQGGCAPATLAAARPWPAPLDRAVTLRARDLTLRDALDRLSAASGVRLSYTSELLPLDRRVCVAAERVPLGDALQRLVAGAGAEPVVVAGQVVLAPARAGSTAAAPEPERESTLERIVVTGTPAGAARRGLAVGLDVLDGPDLARRSATSMAEVMNGTVPGMWMWRRSPSDLLGQFGSVRGASSFVATYPKVYIDGVEVANPLVVTQIDPDLVERVEVIRGPQGAALYGSDAISGVINIVTRHDGGAGMRAELRTEAGAAASDFAPRPVPTHRERLAFRAGNNLRSMAAAVTVGGTGAVYPDAGSRTVSALATGRWVAPRAILTGTFRFYGQSAGAGQNPLLPLVTPPTAPDSSAAGVRYGRRAQAAPMDSSSISPTTTAADQGMRQYTAGVNAAIAPPGRWTFNLLAGIDGYRLNRVADTNGPFPAALDPTLRAGSGSGDRATLRAGGSTRLLGDREGDGDATADLSIAVEHSVLREQTTVAMAHPAEAGEAWAREGTEERVRWRHDTGALAQVSGAWRNTLFGTAGVRLERNDALGGAGELSTLPMLGAAWVRPLGAAELKLRAAYGRGIRPPSVPARENLRVDYHASIGVALEPETQSGFEFGAELYLRGGASLQLTRFDQRASGLIQDVVADFQTTTLDGRAQRHVRYVPQNLGSITNRGWEMQGRWRGGPLSLTGALSFVDSRVRGVAPGYAGDLRDGDRMLAVPARTAGLTAEWAGDGWTGALTASRAWDWINYDRAALAAAFAQPGADPRDFMGEALRAYWRGYNGSTNLRATGSRQVVPRVWLVATGDNLLGRQTGEPDNVTIRPGRTLTVGFRTSF